jgi:SAM-dependent methyltransferase
MTRFETALRAAESDTVRALDLSMFTTRDVVNVILQRSEVLHDVPEHPDAIRAWVRGDDKPLMAIAERHGRDLVRRAIGFIYIEYKELQPTLAAISPKRIADIGCGYGFFDLLAHAEHDCDLVLIDTEESNNRHFKYRQQGAAYASLETARAFLVANNCRPDRIATINPQRQDVTEARDIDLAVSFISCGFHYPCDTYRDFFTRSVKPGGSVILDVRTRLAEEIQTGLEGLGTLSRIGDAAGGKAMRMHLITGSSATVKTA